MIALMPSVCFILLAVQAEASFNEVKLVFGTPNS